MNTANIPFKVKVILGKTTLCPSDYGQMQVGDILILDQKAENPLAIEIENEGVLAGFAGTNEHLKAVQII